VLVAESQAELRQVLEHVLRDVCDPVFAADGFETVRMVSQGLPDLLVLDLQLDRLDGLVTLELVRTFAREIPVVLISALPDPELGYAADRFGVFAVLQKPFRNADLLDAIAGALAGRTGMKGTR
jgi:CheY-like chemotaxis protein